MIRGLIFCACVNAVLSSNETNETTEEDIDLHYEILLPNGFLLPMPFNAANRNYRKKDGYREIPLNSTSPIQGRIIGGWNAKEGEVPYQVAIYLENLGLYCGGSIYGRDTIITAAHCFFEEGKPLKVEQFVVSVGKPTLSEYSPSEQLKKIEKFYLHPSYNPKKSLNDIAVVKLESPICFDKLIQPMGIAPRKYNARGKARISGWGYTRKREPNDVRTPKAKYYPKRLKISQIDIVQKKDCQDKYFDSEFKQFSWVMGHESILCAGVPTGSTDACQGDSGGPLVCKDENGDPMLCGVVSSGIGCGVPKIPSVYADVSHFHDWIVDTAGEPGSRCT